MKTLARLGVLVLSVVLGFSVTPAVSAPEAEPGFAVSVSRTVLRGGETLTATGRADRPCAWIIDWNGQRRTRSATRIVARFVAPSVREKTVIPLRGTCFYASPAPPRTAATVPPARGSKAYQRLVVLVPKSLNQTILVTVLPAGAVVDPPVPPGPGGGGNGGLPGTGGPDLWILLAGLATLLVGASLIRISSPGDEPFVPISR